MRFLPPYRTMPPLSALRTGGLRKGRMKEGFWKYYQNLPSTLLSKEGENVFLVPFAAQTNRRNCRLQGYVQYLTPLIQTHVGLALYHKAWSQVFKGPAGEL